MKRPGTMLKPFLGTLLCLLIVDAGVQAQAGKPGRSTPKAKRVAKLKCGPQRLFRGDTLTLDMATPHGGDLAVRAPDGTDFFVVYIENEEGPGAGSMMDPDKFMKMSQLRLVTDKTKAKPWVYGRDKNELIFMRTGWYQVRLSENLQTDDGTSVYTCRVHYAHKTRP